MGKIRVLIVDDSAFMRKVIDDILSADPDIEVIDRAKNGLECIKKVKELKPDVITLDIEMPVMDGLEALEQLMKNHPLPVVMLSSLTKEGADATIRALELGAFDFVAKPSGPISLDIHKVADRILERVKAAATAKRRNIQLRPSYSVPPQPPAIAVTKNKILPKPFATRGIHAHKLVAIGTSTGGPKALQTVLTGLPANFCAPIAIVQHMPPGFTKSLAQRLDTLCQIHVVEAENGQVLENGTAYIAPGGYHMEIVPSTDNRLQIRLTQTEPRNGHRPSVDTLFESVGELAGVEKWAVIMTGMGSDGTKGLSYIKEKGQALSVIEDESSCVVFGMPRAAIQAGLADKVVPLENIADTLVRIVI
ncbi:protein-glutamate methylesterase/protein-glutamine glutaminase [Brevibacillus ginsengisoli]|uniref:protein-glutamate methylesterase/protein-glutamine glutaminase n=1 Tax=Brevibacillus ginsengisoli TaxID=363854 RepID=UPI003CED663D